MTRRKWTYRPSTPPEIEKQSIGAACQAFVEQVLKPRFLPEIRPSQFNYPIDIYGKWHGGKYRFIQRFRSDCEDALEPEFDRPFARLEYVSRDRFDLSYFRHTGQWWTVYRDVSLAEALSLLESEGIFHPVS